MTINFRAVHVRNPWRKVGNHETLARATDGEYGARNLLLRIGRVAERWNQYGAVGCVFVWEEGAATGYAFRLRPGEPHSIQKVEIPIAQLQAFDRKRSCSDAEIDLCFRSTSTVAESEAVLPDLPNAEDAQRPPVESESVPWNIELLYPDELQDGGHYIEGLSREVLVNAFERSVDARNACIAHYGAVCQVCEFEFSTRYGQIGTGFIHVHHRVPIASIGEEYTVRPLEDLVPVCPNCHAMLHRREPPLSVDELRAMLIDCY